jgi:hypothetical protein
MAAASLSVEREARLGRLVGEPEMTLEGLADGLLNPPLYTVIEARRFATVYSAVYRAGEGGAEYLWPGKLWRQSFRQFHEGSYTHSYAPAPLSLAAS